jgi:hypothetical protein
MPDSEREGGLFDAERRLQAAQRAEDVTALDQLLDDNLSRGAHRSSAPCLSALPGLLPRVGLVDHEDLASPPHDDRVDLPFQPP